MVRSLGGDNADSTIEDVRRVVRNCQDQKGRTRDRMFQNGTNEEVWIEAHERYRGSWRGAAARRVPTVEETETGKASCCKLAPKREDVLFVFRFSFVTSVVILRNGCALACTAW